VYIDDSQRSGGSEWLKADAGPIPSDQFTIVPRLRAQASREAVHVGQPGRRLVWEETRELVGEMSRKSPLWQFIRLDSGRRPDLID
jgi:hypothetical protein